MHLIRQNRKLTTLKSLNISTIQRRSLVTVIQAQSHTVRGTSLVSPLRITLISCYMWKNLFKNIKYVSETGSLAEQIILHTPLNMKALIVYSKQALPAPLEYSPVTFLFPKVLPTILSPTTFSGIISAVNTDVLIKTKLDYVKASGMMTFSDKIYDSLKDSTQEGHEFRESCIFQMLHFLYHFKNYSFQDENDILSWVKDVMKVSSIFTYVYPPGHAHVFKYLMSFKQHCMAYMLAGLGFNPALLHKDLPLVDYTSFNHAVSATTFMENYVLKRTYGSFIENNKGIIQITAVNPDNLTSLQKQYQSICYQQMKQPNGDFNVSFTAENITNKLKFLDVKFRDSPEKTLPCLKGHISITPSLAQEPYMKRFLGDIGTVTKNKPITPSIAAAKDWSVSIKEILDNKTLSATDKLIYFYALNDSQMKNDILDHTLVPGKVVEAFSDSEFDLYIHNNEIEIDALIKEISRDFSQFNLFTKNQTAYLKGIDMVMEKIAARMPIIGPEVHAGFLALKQLAIQL